MTAVENNGQLWNRAPRGRSRWLWLIVGGACGLPAPAWGAEAAPAPRGLDVWSLLEAGGTIGWIIVASSVWMVALFLQQLLILRRGAVMPSGLAQEVHARLGAGQVSEALEACQARPSFLAYVLSSGLRELDRGYSAVEKALEDAAQQQAARLFRGLEYFTVIGTVAPMLGLLGTVWGMILAFMEFEQKANPQVSELAPGIYKALVTTLQGLVVAIPALTLYAMFRNRVDELVSQASLLAEHVFAGHRRNVAARQAAKSATSPASTRVRPPQAAGDT
ncbi:MAG: MotA/TolQ/ExbB proton channel family protein [Planctomycetaceae bacterium]